MLYGAIKDALMTRRWDRAPPQLPATLLGDFVPGRRPLGNYDICSDYA
ncbi:hypothetical protein D4764_13G0003580 [Takifugu flavidus]|uniref:Uncharacterized protein n=1 Tax=Takifugu flavidus TaxID=433684 RepID=A0A5C6P921_9TELE|nr:hypothetical protein D4764_13G0003580 [Takifugu flavidus]